ncbi:hypothetical protein CEP52_010380 [Fusarium oligoseptatum]|uniref:Uncharacterized protein n=1 Tax=Fusarium oligoseptatum TaxID=2604345 RepID=A0A428T8L3_9HYPO|nr:hypothetical protein CEP52_010380 [Fusarium oligoseptatum]
MKCVVARQSSDQPGSTTVDTLAAVEEHLKKWKCHVRSRSAKSKLQETKVKITHLLGNDKMPDDGSSRDKILLGSSPEELESLINSMQNLVEQVKWALPPDANVTSRRHERKLIVLQDDIRLQVKLANDLGFAIMRWPDSTPYQMAQALEARVKDWTEHEMEWCRFRDKNRNTGGEEEETEKTQKKKWKNKEVY